MKNFLWLNLLCFSALAYDISSNIDSVEKTIKQNGFNQFYKSVIGIEVNLGNNKRQFCTGVALTNHEILTAAHCVINANDEPFQMTNFTFYLPFQGRFGEKLYGLNNTDGEIIVSSQYSDRLPMEKDQQKYDLALIKLTGGANKKSLIPDENTLVGQGIGIPGLAIVDKKNTLHVAYNSITDLKKNTKVLSFYAAGWGSRYMQDSNSIYKAIHFISVNSSLLGINGSLGLMGALNKYFLWEIGLVHGLVGNSYCPDIFSAMEGGDSGGPLFIQEGDSRKFQLIGIATSENINSTGVFSTNLYSALVLENPAWQELLKHI